MKAKTPDVSMVRTSRPLPSKPRLPTPATFSSRPRSTRRNSTSVKPLNRGYLFWPPKASYCDAILRCEEAVTVTTIAKDYGMSATAFNKKLSELGIQYKQGGVWFPYQKYASEGYTKSETCHATDEDGKDHARVLTKWTQKGRLFLYEQLKAAGILPCVERMAA